MPRRDFLGRFAILSSLGAVLFALVGILRLPKAAVLPSPSKRFTVKLPESLAPGIPYMPPGRSVAIFKDPDGIYAVSIICTHLGCVVKVEGDGFKCPCHGSQFRRDGEVVQGPAPKALPWLAVSLSADGTCIVDEGTVITHGRKVQA
jgi:cytochrome b6-f complex iron-sulfur subunit